VSRRDGGAIRLAREAGRAAGRAGAARCLLLDVDGTLAPIAATPDRARVPDSTLAALRQLLRQDWTVIVVSGRDRAEIRRLIPLRGIRAVGSHGFDRPRGGPVDAGVRRRLQRLGRAATALRPERWGARLERKPGGLAFHDRGLAGRRLRAWRERLRAFLATQDLRGLAILGGRRVTEIRPSGIHKGLAADTVPAVRAAIRRSRFDASLIAVGDDRSDEDLFQAIDGHGLTVRVGRPGIRTSALRRLPSPSAVRRFLRLLSATDGR
jgi:trehalose 6-phosphate synthase/phosphatase